MNSSNDHLLFTKELAPPDLEYTITCIYVLVLNYRDAVLYILYCFMCMYVHSCADLKGGSRPPPPPEFANLNIAHFTGNEKIKLVIFHICALPQLYVKVEPPLPPEKFSGSAPDTVHISYSHIVPQ